MPPKLLLLGSNGQVGQDLQQTLAPLGTLIPLARPQLDMTNLAGLRTLIQSHSPDIIINAAAYTAVDRAEQEPELAHLINSKAPEVIAQEADRLNAKLIHLSTDYVFNGQHNQPYRPDHPTAPLEFTVKVNSTENKPSPNIALNPGLFVQLGSTVSCFAFKLHFLPSEPLASTNLAWKFECITAYPRQK